MNSLGKRIKTMRIQNNLSQMDLANLLYISDKTISSWENDRTIPDINFIFKLANIFHISFYTLAYGEYSNPSNLELEIKLKVNIDEWNRILNIIKSKSLYLGEEAQYATYFQPKFRKFGNEWLRIRCENGKYVLNYKKKIEKNCCNEYETIVDNALNLEKILTCLNMDKIGVIDKKRNKYLYKDKYEFSFDDVKDIGMFVEVEVKQMTSSYEVEYDNLINLLNELKIDLNLIDNRRYFDYLLGVNVDD